MEGYGVTKHKIWRYQTQEESLGAYLSSGVYLLKLSEGKPKSL